MCLRVYIAPELFDAALCVDQERTTNDPEAGSAARHALTPNTIAFRDEMFVIGKQGEREVVFGLEPEVRFDRVGADTEHGDPFGLNLRVQVTEPLGLRRSATGEVFRIEIEQEPSSSEAS